MADALTPAALHHAILSGFVEQGYPPTSASLQSLFQTDAATVKQALRDLHNGHGIVLHPHDSEVWVAHPFSSAPTPFSVWRGSRVWWGNCAWCSFGIAALLGGDDVRIATTAGAEGEPLTATIDRHRVREDLWVHFPVPMSRAWDNVIYTCSMMLLFRSEREIDNWARRHAAPRGDAQRAQRVYDFARVWYGRHLDRNWRKWSVEEARRLFARFGFQGPIWELPASAERF
jgi:hypothetical protein